MKNLMLLSIAFAAFGCAEYQPPATPTVGAPSDGGAVASDAGSTNEVPPAESADWVCRGGKDAVGDYFECNPKYLNGTPSEAYFVGNCPSEGITGYFTGTYVTVMKNADGWYRYYLTGTTEVCELTYAQCRDTTNSTCWAQYGLNSGLPSSVAGPYRSCNGSCSMHLQRVPGHTPKPLGN